jgi:hypothetical protein
MLSSTDPLLDGNLDKKDYLRASASDSALSDNGESERYSSIRLAAASRHGEHEHSDDKESFHSGASGHAESPKVLSDGPLLAPPLDRVSSGTANAVTTPTFSWLAALSGHEQFSDDESFRSGTSGYTESRKGTLVDEDEGFESDGSLLEGFESDGSLLAPSFDGGGSIFSEDN